MGGNCNRNKVRPRFTRWMTGRSVGVGEVAQASSWAAVSVSLAWVEIAPVGGLWAGRGFKGRSPRCSQLRPWLNKGCNQNRQLAQM